MPTSSFNIYKGYYDAIEYSRMKKDYKSLKDQSFLFKSGKGIKGKGWD